MQRLENVGKRHPGRTAGEIGEGKEEQDDGSGNEDEKTLVRTVAVMRVQGRWGHRGSYGWMGLGSRQAG